MRLAKHQPLPFGLAEGRWWMKPEPPRRGPKREAILADMEKRGIFTRPTWAIAVDPLRWGNGGNFLAYRENRKRGMMEWTRRQEPQRWTEETAKRHAAKLAETSAFRFANPRAVEVGPPPPPE